MNAESLLALYERVAEAPDAVARLRRFVLDLAVRGKLVAQDPRDEPASELLKRITMEKARLVQAGETKKLKPLESVREPAFGVPSNWTWTRLGNIAAYIQRGKSPKYTPTDGSPVISQKCVQWAGLDLTVAKQVTLESLSRYEPIRFLRDGDLLWNSTGTGTIGRVIRLVNPPGKLVCDSHVTVVRCLEVDPEYVKTWLRTDHVYGVMEERAAGSTNQVELTAQMANGQPIPLPPLAEQRRIVAKVEELMTLLDRLEAARTAREATRDRLTAASLARLASSDTTPEVFPDYARFALGALPALTTCPGQIKSLRQTILNLAVRGKLVGQDPNDEPASELLKRIKKRRQELAAAQGTRKKRPVEPLADEDALNLPTGWAAEAFANLIDPTATISYGVLVPGADVDEGVLFVRAQDLMLSDHPAKPSKTIAPEIEAKYARTRLSGGEILLCVVGSIGKLGVAPPHWAGANIARAVARISPVDLIDRDYLLVFLRSDRAQSYFEEATRTLAQPTLNVGLIEKLPAPLPPRAEQHRIVAKVDALMTLCDRLEAGLDDAETTRQRLLDALLHGALEPAALPRVTEVA